MSSESIRELIDEFYTKQKRKYNEELEAEKLKQEEEDNEPRRTTDTTSDGSS